MWLLLGLFLCSGMALVAVNTVLTFSLFRGRLAEICEAARSTYEHGGPESSRLLLQGLALGPGGRVRLLNGAGEDVISGPTGQPDAHTQTRPPFLPPPSVIVSAGKYSCVALPPDRPPGLPLGPFSWVLPFVSVLCCAVGTYITWRMRRIEKAVKHFGEGQLGVRLPSDPHDAIGRLAEAFNQMAERIEMLVRSNQRLCADMAHELRSPLARLALAMPGARRGAPGALNRIEAEANRINDLVDELLDVARAEVDPMAFETGEIDVESLLTETADRCSVEATHHGCTIRLDLVEPGVIQGNVELLRRAIENVVRNAVDHSEAGSQILLSAASEVNAVNVSVRDWGSGVPQTALAEIFRPFYRVGAARWRSTGGVGLGLAIAQRAIVLHGGSIVAENALPGLRVTIGLPRFNKDHGQAEGGSSSVSRQT
jgi:signal transduction histidine kinase